MCYWFVYGTNDNFVCDHIYVYVMHAGCPIDGETYLILDI